MPGSRRSSIIAAAFGIAFAIVILAVSGLFAQSLNPVTQSVSHSGYGASLYPTTSPPNAEANFDGSTPKPLSSSSSQAISNLSTSSVASLMLLGAISLAISFGSAFIISRRLK